MPRHSNTARRIDFVLRAFPKLRRKLESVGTRYHRIREGFDYDIEYNGERWLLQTLARETLLNTVFDVGANCGDWAMLALAANQDAKLHCFEICPPTFQKLAKQLSGSLARNRNIVLNSTGLSDSDSEIKINYVPDDDVISTIFPVISSKRVEVINGKVMRGKDYCVKHGITSIDCLKLDVEGAEHLAMNGFDDMLTPNRIPVIQFEYGMISIVTKFLLRDFYLFLESRGYKVGKLFPDRVRFREYRFEDEDFLGPNYIAASPEIAKLLEPK